MPPSVPLSATSLQQRPKQREKDAALAHQTLSVKVWLDGLEIPLPLREEPTTPYLTRSRLPLGPIQPKLTTRPYVLRPVRARKRPMDDVDNHDHGVEPRRSGRIKKTRRITGRLQEDDRSHSEAGNARDQMSLQPRRRGRPPKAASRSAAAEGLLDAEGDALENVQTTLPLRDTGNILWGPALPPPLSPTRSGTTRTSGSSPSRVNQIKRDHLVNCTPQIQFKTMAEAKKYLPHHIMQIRKDVLSPLLHEQRIVPPVLKDQIKLATDTPAKSRPPLNDSNFAPTDRFPKNVAEIIWSKVQHVLRRAAELRTKTAPESQWCSFIIASLLELIEEINLDIENEAKFKVCDVSTLSIDPPELRPSHANPEISANKKIDFAMGLALHYEETTALQNGTYRGRHPHKSGTSINQTLSCWSHVPMYLNIEVKKKNVAEDPMVQLGIWIAAEFMKRKLEGYCMKMPVFAIEIQEDVWNLWQAFAVVEDSTLTGVHFVGPESIGDTKSELGVFKILYVLDGLAEWADKVFREWVRREVIAVANPAHALRQQKKRINILD